MADRTVDLVIRAKNEASAVLDQITSALDGFTRAQSGVVAGADNTASALTRLASGVKDISQGIKNLTDFGRVQAEMTKLGAAAQALGEDAGKASIEANRLAAAFNGVEQRQAQAAASTKAATAAVKAQTEVVAQNVRAQKSLDAQIAATAQRIESLDRRSQGGQRLTDGQQDTRAALESRLRTLTGLSETQGLRTDEATSALVPLQANERAAAAASAALAGQAATLRKELATVTASADTLAGRLASVTKESQALNTAAAGVAERLGLDASKADSYAQALAKIEGAQTRVTLAIQRNEAAKAAANVAGPNVGAFADATKNGTLRDRADVLRDQNYRVEAAQRAQKIALDRRNAAEEAQKRSPSEENEQTARLTSLDFDTVTIALKKEVATLREIRQLSAQVRADQEAAINATKEKVAKESQSRNDALLASIDKAIREQERLHGIRVEQDAKEAEADRQRDVKAAQKVRSAAQTRLDQTPGPEQEANGPLAPGVAAQTTAGYREAIAALGQLKAAEDQAREAVAAAAAAQVAQGHTGAEVAAAIQEEKAALAAASAAYAAQVQQIERVRAVLQAAREATTQQTAAEQALNKALQEGANVEALFIQAQAAGLNREAAGNAAANQVATLGRLNAAQRVAAEAAAALAAAEREEIPATESVAAAQQRAIAAKRALAAASRELAEVERQEAAARQASIAGYANLETRVGGLLAVYAGFQQIKSAIKDATSAAVDYEAAQVRVTQALGQGDERGAAAFQHIVDQATRLKLPVLEATQEFGKFVAAVKGTSIEGEAALRIFDNLQTISRGFKLDPESIQRGTIALRDLAASGQLSLRYINQFDRAVPVGLLSALAQASDTAKGNIQAFLGEVHKGGASLDLLDKALEIVAKRVEKGLPTALTTAQSTLADFQNALLQAQVSFTNGGFLTDVVAAVNELNTALRSDSGRAGLRDLGGIIGQVISLLTKLVTNAKTVLEVMGAIGAIKLVSLVTGAESIAQTVAQSVGALSALKVAKLEAAAADATVIAGLEAVAVAETQTAAVTVGLGEAFLALATSPLGIALAVGAGVAALIAFSSGSSRAASAGDDYNRVLEDMKKASDDAGKSIQQTTEAMREQTTVDIDKAIVSQRDAIKETTAELSRFSDAQRRTKVVNFFSGGNNDDLNRVQDFTQAVLAGQVPVTELKQKVDEFYATLKDPDAQEHLLAEIDTFKKLADQYTKLAALAQASGGKSKLSGIAEDAARDTNALTAVQNGLKGVVTEENAVEKATQANEAAFDRLKKYFPEIKEQVKDFSKELDIAAARAAAIKLDIAHTDAAGGGIGGLPLSRESLDKTNLAISDAQKDEILKAYQKRPGFSDEINRIGTRVFGFESGGNDKAVSPTGAVGRGQFTAGTFLEQYKKAYGNPGDLTDKQILELRKNPEISEQLGKQYLQFQAAQLEKYGSPTTSIGAKAYAGYNIGTPAARRLLEADPNSNARAAINDDSVYGPNKALYQGTVAESIARLEKIVGGGAKLNDKGQTPIENRDLQITKIFDKSIRDLESKTKAAGDGKDNDKKGQYVAAQGQKFTDEALAKNTEANNGKEVKELTKEQQKQLEIIKQKAAAEYAATHKDEDEKAKLEELTTLTERRKVALEELQSAEKKNDTSAIDTYKKKVADLTEQIKKAIPEAKKMVDALGDQKGTLKLEQTQAALDDVKKSSDDVGKKLADDFAGDAMSALDGFVSDLTKGKNAMDALKNAFLKFASSFLKQIAEMILKKALLGAIGGNPGGAGGTGGAQSGGIFGGLGSAIGGGGGGGGIMSLFGGLFHEGGMIGGAAEMTRRVDPAWFANAPRFHEGGFPGLKPSEVPIIAQKGEQVLSKAQVSANGRETAGAPMQQPTRNILVMGDSEVAAAMAGSHGEAVMMSHIKRNATTISKMVK